MNAVMRRGSHEPRTPGQAFRERYGRAVPLTIRHARLDAAGLAARGYRRAIAGITLPNDASLALHRSVGFEVIGTERRVGWKLGAWRDVLRMQRDLAPDDEPPGVEPAEPVT